MELKILDNKGKENGSITLDESAVSVKASPAVLHEAVVAYIGLSTSGHSRHQNARRSIRRRR